jgi:hypothetical protein
MDPDGIWIPTPAELAELDDQRKATSDRRTQRRGVQRRGGMTIASSAMGAEQPKEPRDAG